MTIHKYVRMPPVNRRGIPARILYGSGPYWTRPVATMYRALLTQELVKRIHRAFLVKSTGLGDDMGNKWKKLAPRTIKIKEALGVKSPERINIRTGALVASTRAGPVANNRYYPPKNQRHSTSKTTIHLHFLLPHAEKVQLGISDFPATPPRPFVPEDLTKWLVESHESIIGRVKSELERRTRVHEARHPHLARRHEWLRRFRGQS